MKISEYTPLTPESEAALTARLPDAEAAEELVMRSMQNAVKYLSRVSNRNKSEEELVSLCYAGLCKAVRNLKPDKGRFFPYAKIYLRSALFASWKSKSIVRHAETISEGEMFHLLIGDEEQCQGDSNGVTIGDTEDFNFDDIDTRERWAAASKVLAKVLTDHEKVVIQLRFNLDYSFEQIAGFMGTTRSAAQGACERALRKVRAEMVNSAALRKTL